ncbi:MAG: Sec-independent protein translocase protein TatB [Alphaproteobacteria bacterium]
MLDIGKAELLVVVVILLLVVGPKELPRLLRSIFGMVRKVRSMANDFQNQMEDMARDADLNDVQNTIKAAGSKENQEKLLEQFGVDAETQAGLNETGSAIAQRTKQIEQDANELAADMAKAEQNALGDSVPEPAPIEQSTSPEAPSELPPEPKTANKGDT